MSDPERWISVAGGAAITAFGLRRRSLGGLALSALGAAIVWRGASGHCHVYEALGVSSAPDDDGGHVSVRYGRGIRVERSITIGLPAPEVYSFFRNLENLPRFLSHLHSVTVIDAKRSHWVTKGPAGSKAAWDAEIINEAANELIAWRSVGNSQIDNAGSIHFKAAAGNRGTDVRVVLRYDPPAGKLGAAVTMLMGEDPDHQIREDLRSLKMLLETREIATTDGQSSGAPARSRFREALSHLVR
ncbi:MAG: hypothetical protein QOC81_2641 [Thermoanaerobaculia bacterium]|nr:hypothetical protein [Thermoanaerobaculia bacterium]